MMLCHDYWWRGCNHCRCFNTFESFKGIINWKYHSIISDKYHTCVSFSKPVTLSLCTGSLRWLLLFLKYNFVNNFNICCIFLIIYIYCLLEVTIYTHILLYNDVPLITSLYCWNKGNSAVTMVIIYNREATVISV